jgi:hypothetical protein
VQARLSLPAWRSIKLDPVFTDKTLILLIISIGLTVSDLTVWMALARGVS